MKIDITQLKNQYCQMLFGQNANNVLTLLDKIAVAYNLSMIEKTAENKDLMFVYNALSSSDPTVINTLQRLNGKNLAPALYDAHKAALYTTFDAIKQSCYKFDEKDIDPNQTEVPVYNIKKTSQKLLINVARLERNSNPTDKELDKFLQMYCENRSYRDIQKDYKSLSFVDTNDLKVFRDPNEYVTFVYPDDIPNNFVITISRKDACVDFYEKTPTTKMAFYYNTPQTLLDSTNDFNEIAVLRKDTMAEESREIMPVALLCTKTISPLEQRIAQKLGLKIIFSENQYTPKISKKKNLDWKAYQPCKKQIKYDFEL